MSAPLPGQNTPRTRRRKERREKLKFRWKRERQNAKGIGHRWTQIL